MANTFELIDSYTVGAGGTSSITFSAIDQTYTDLVLKISLRTSFSGSADVALYFNGQGYPNSASSNRSLVGDGSGSASNTDGTSAYIRIGGSNGSSSTASTFSSYDVYIPNYAGSTNKSLSIDSVTENNGTTAYANMIASLKSSTAAITSIQIDTGQTLVQYTTAYLYGVKNA